jgi:hypothetical protein
MPKASKASTTRVRSNRTTRPIRMKGIAPDDIQEVTVRVHTRSMTATSFFVK